LPQERRIGAAGSYAASVDSGIGRRVRGRFIQRVCSAMKPLPPDDAREMDELLRERIRLVPPFILLLVVFNCLDWAEYPEYALRWLAYRSATAVLLVFAIQPIVSRIYDSAPFPQLLVYVVGVSVCVALMEYDAGGFGSAYYVVFILVGWAFSVIMPVETRRSLVIGGSILLAFLVAGALSGEPIGREVLFECLVLFGAVLFMVVGNHLATDLYLRQLHAQQETDRLVHRLETLSRRDPLTGAPNRLAMDERLEVEFSRLLRKGIPFSFVMLDVDHFKRVNDRFGHPAGDRVLVRLCREIEEQLRIEDEFFRIGGEEFAIVLADSGIAATGVAVERLRRAVEVLSMEHEGDRHRITISAGATEAVPTDDVGSLVERADTALYRAKHSGRNRVECITATVPREASARRLRAV